MRVLLGWVFGSGVVMGGIEDIDHEDQGLAGELPLVAVGILRRDHQHHLAADRNVQQLLVPAGDHLLGPLDEAEGGATFPGGVELLAVRPRPAGVVHGQDRKSTRLNSSHVAISYAVFCSKKISTRTITKY